MKKSKSKTKNVTDTFKKIISPTEFLQTAMVQVNKTKEDISSKVTGEMISLIRKIDFVKEFSKFAEDHRFKISMDIEIRKKDKTK